MDSLVREGLLDHLLPGWREVQEVRGERWICCPLHEDHHPSLRLKTSNLCWFCDPCSVGGGAWDLALKVLGKDRARELVRELGQSSSTSPSPSHGR